MRRSPRRPQAIPSATTTGDDLLSLWVELGGLDTLHAADLGNFVLLSQKHCQAVRDRVTGLSLSVAQLTEAQQWLQWQQLHSWQPPAAAAAAAVAPSGWQPQQQQQPQQQRAEETAAAPPPPNAIARVAARMPQLRKLKLFHNTVTQSASLSEQLGRLALVTQLSSLTLCDAASCAMPSSGLRAVGKLKSLKQLSLLVQSIGTRTSFDQSLPVRHWKNNIMVSLAHAVCPLTGLQELRLRFICGDRGFFFAHTPLIMIKPLSQLTLLDLGYIDLNPQGLTQLRHLAQLRKCILYGRLSSLTAMDLTVLASWPRLQRLEMFHDCPSHLDGLEPAPEHPLQLEAAEVQQLSDVLSGMQHLSWLNLPMSHKTTPVLSLLSKLPALEQLFLQSIERGQAVIRLDGRSVGPSVRVLQIDNVELTGNELDRLCGLTQLESLTMFNLKMQNLGLLHGLSRLSSLSRLAQFTFDALASDDPAHMAVFDSVVISAIAPAWQRLHSLHLSFSALGMVQQQDGHSPEHLVLDFSQFGALQHLSLYVSPDAALVDQEQLNTPLVLLADKLPAGLKSLCCSALRLAQPHLLPTSLRHLWLADVTPSSTPSGFVGMLHCLAHTQTQLETLVLRIAYPGGAARSPVSSTGDLALLASSLTQLTCLGLSLPTGRAGLGLLDLKALAPLTGMRQLLMDYCCKPVLEGEAAAAAAAAAGAAAPNAAAAAAEPGPQQQQPDPQQGQQQQGQQPAAAAAEAGAPGQAAAAPAEAAGAAAAGAAPPLADQQPAPEAAAADAAGPGQDDGQQQQQQQEQQAAVVQTAAGIAGAVHAITAALAAMEAVNGDVVVPPCQAALNALTAAAEGVLAGEEGALAAALAAVNQGIAAGNAVLMHAIAAAEQPGQAAIGAVAAPVLISAQFCLHRVRDTLNGIPLPAPIVAPHQQLLDPANGALVVAGALNPIAAELAEALAAAGDAAGVLLNDQLVAAAGAAVQQLAGAAAAAQHAVMQAQAAIGAAVAALQAANAGQQQGQPPPAGAAAAGGGGGGGVGAGAPAAAAAAAGAGGAAAAGVPGAAGGGGGQGGGESDSEGSESEGEDDDDDEPPGMGWMPLHIGPNGWQFAHQQDPPPPAANNNGQGGGGGGGGGGGQGPGGGPVLPLDAEEVVEQLAHLSQHMRRLRGLWLTDNVLLRYPAMPLQQLLAEGAPCITVRSAESDWFYGTGFPIGSSVDCENPVEWHRFTPWNIL